MNQEPTDQFVESKSNKICVIAGPGAGKSYSLRKRIKYLLEIKKIDPKKILVLTFTSVSAQDLKKTIKEIENVKNDILQELEVTTLHSLALKMLTYGEKKVRLMQNFEIRMMLRDLGSEEEIGKYRIKERLYKECKEKNASSLNQQEKKFQRDKNTWLKQHKGYILDDLIHEACNRLEHNGSKEEKERWSYSHVLVDEYQDLNIEEQRFVNLLVAPEGTISVIGDDDQSIYEFKGASPQAIRDFTKNDDYETIFFSDCYRCPSSVVKMSKNLIMHNKDRLEKEFNAVKGMKKGIYQHITCATPAKEIYRLCNKIQKEYGKLKEYGLGWKEIVVLAPTKERGKAIYKALKEAAIPATFCFRGSDFTDDKTKESFSLLSLAAHPEDLVSWRYLLGAGDHECNAKSYKYIRELANKRGKNILRVLEEYEDELRNSSSTRSLLERYKKIKKKIDDICVDPSILFQGIDPENGQYYSLLKRAMDLKMHNEGFEGVLNEVLEEIYSPECAAESDHVRIMSLHAAKGLSARVVIIMSAVDGLIPLKSTNKKIEEEQRRLFYVAITRCKGGKRRKYPGKLIICTYRRLEDGSQVNETPYLKEMSEEYTKE